MSRVRVRSSSDIVEDSVFANLFDINSVRRITTIVYGRPMTGKSIVTIYEAARLAKIYGGGVRIYTSEPNYATEEEHLRRILEGMGVKYEIIFEESAEKLSLDLFKLTKRTIEDRENFKSEEGDISKWTPEWRVVVLDSLGSLAASEEDHISYLMRRSARTRAASVVPSLSKVVRNLSRYAAEADGWAFAIAHATSTAGTGLYEGLVEYKPSFTEKAIHYSGAVVLLVSPKDYPENIRTKIISMEKRLKDTKMAVLVLHRRGGAGRGVVYEFVEEENNDIKYTRPKPLFFVEYQHQEEEMI